MKQYSVILINLKILPKTQTIAETRQEKFQNIFMLFVESHLKMQDMFIKKIELEQCL